ncbi:MAG TPA: hypothetical protein VFS54_02480 [Solirubrobacterales bacterium]|nr:hypothetical protein [Solirubrobacterales bacterium]
MTSIELGLLGLVALLALALAGPASASAEAVWQHEGVPLAGHAEMGLEGSQIFVTEAGGMICQSEATLTAEPGSTGVVTELTTTKCQGLFGELAGCTATGGEQLAGPWDVHVTTSDLVVTKAALVRTFNEGCPVKRIESSIPELTTTLVEPGAIGEIEWSGEGSASIDGGPAGEYQEFGSWFVTPAGTYGIG